jgi:curli production assembly/transport component CsgG
MNMTASIKRNPLAVILAATFLLAGCSWTPFPSAEPQSLATPEITMLPPPPKRALTVGIYTCTDTTGQRRPSGQAQELSTAVPMDCTPYMIEAVRSMTPGYLNLVERQHVDELLRERQIATLALNSSAQAATLAPAQNQQPPAAHNGQRVAQAAPPAPAQRPAPPAARLNTLRVAEVLLIGQVVAYDRQTTQASAGFSLGGVGVTGTYVTDVFSIRAVAVQTGDVLGQATITKSITSLRGGGHNAKIWPTTVMEAELGGATNEAVGFALGITIRSALTDLVKRGVTDGWWQT